MIAMNKYRILITLSLIGTILVGCDNSKNDTNKQQLANPYKKKRMSSFMIVFVSIVVSPRKKGDFHLSL